ncbi:MAG: hypothetical protein CFE21_06685 [Bacteroidetes bacterium B1(2017)]|nr:MAG: hypothetical protein CFE21_06685 [Bacteroidetes bacterium B1(2017)]
METQYSIQSSKLKVIINTHGAEMISVLDKQTGFEFMWNGNPEIWNRHAPVLFPIVGKLNQNRITIEGKIVEMSQHGFARDCEFEAIEVYEDLLKSMLVSDDVSLSKYPYQFKFFITYQVFENVLETTYTILNEDVKTMYFSVGAHPGFMLPEANLENYYIEFSDKENLERHLLKDGLFTGESELLSSNQKQLNLNHELFEKDAIVFKKLASKTLSLKKVNSNYCIQLDFDQFPFMGIWTKAGQENFICLEPWLGIADGCNFNSDISQKEGIVALEPGSDVSFSYKLTFSAD